jgi:o-succinylbenzoate synthase
VVAVRLSRFDIFRFSLPLNRPLTIGNQTLVERNGLVIELKNDQGLCALGEVSPLPGLSRESLDVAENQLCDLRIAVLHTDIPDNLTQLQNGFTQWLEGHHPAPSVKFGFESAVLGLLAKTRGTSLFAHLRANPRTTVTINALLTGSTSAVLEKVQAYLQKGFWAFKLKVGRNTVPEDAAMVREVRKELPENAILRLDANRAWNVHQAMSFSEELSDTAIAYIEEPVATFDQLELLVGSDRFALPIALDESLSEISPERLSLLSRVKAIVIKPALLGIEHAIRFAKEATRQKIQPVISSAFESGIGLAVLTELAASVGWKDIPAGLDTLDWFEYDLLRKPLKIENGAIVMANIREIEKRVNRTLLSPVSYDS